MNALVCHDDQFFFTLTPSCKSAEHNIICLIENSLLDRYLIVKCMAIETTPLLTTLLQLYSNILFENTYPPVLQSFVVFQIFDKRCFTTSNSFSIENIVSTKLQYYKITID